MPDFDDDSQLFRELVGDVKPVLHDKHQATPKKPKPVARFHEADEQAVLTELLDPEEYGMGFDDGLETGDELGYAGNGLDKNTWRKLRRGQFRIDDTLDLHGFRVEAAHEAIKQFILRNRAVGNRCLRIVHGKGHAQDEGMGGKKPVLKRSVDGWLRRNSTVLGYCSCLPQHGGTGAVYVLVRKQK